MPIDPKDISVVVQGPVARDTGPDHNSNPTPAVLASVRRVLPGAELILSTWKGTDPSGLDCDRLVLNDDPGPWPFLAPTRGENCNRLLVSTRNGLAMASRPYAVKLRSDTVLENSGFLTCSDTAGGLVGHPRVFSAPVVSCTVYTADPRRLPYLFYVSDLFHFGQTTDLQTLFSYPCGPVAWLTVPVAPEQFFWMSVLRQAGVPVRLRDAREVTARNLALSERSIMGNFVLAGPTDLGLLLPRRLYRHADMCYDPGKAGRLRAAVGRPRGALSILQGAAERTGILIRATAIRWANPTRL